MEDFLEAKKVIIRTREERDAAKSFARKAVRGSKEQRAFSRIAVEKTFRVLEELEALEPKPFPDGFN